jgi:autotransporter family porin
VYNLRHFADTTGVGVRDTLRVAIADLGEGPGNTFINTGTLRLPAVTSGTLDPSVSLQQYLPLGNPNNAMAVGGPLQGHLVGVASFTNSGTIDLQSNPVAGDVLVITGARQAGLAATQPIAAVAGPGTFISGGTLKLDTVLNGGGAATQSDTLVVDGTSLGVGGATKTVQGTTAHESRSDRRRAASRRRSRTGAVSTGPSTGPPTGSVTDRLEPGIEGLRVRCAKHVA